MAAKDPNVFFDHLGDNGSVRIWVHTGDEMRFRSSDMHAKEVENELENTRKGTEKDMERMKSSLVQNHGVIPEQHAVAQALARGGEQAFQNPDGFLPDVMELVKEPTAAVPLPDTSSYTAASPTPGSDPSPDKKVVKPWVDRDRVVSATVRSATAQINSFKQKSVEQLGKLKQSLEKYKGITDGDFQKNFEGEVKVLEVRLEALSLVLAGVLS